MRDRQVVIYTAANSHQAHLLKNQLAEYGVWCVVQNDSHQSTDGMAPSPQVVVRAEDFEFAREVAEEFDRTLFRPNEEPAADEDEASGPTWTNWPRCPSCRRLRQTRCPVCKVAGTDFSLAEFIESANDGDWDDDQNQEDHDADEKPIRFVADDSDENEPVLLLCSLCDEAFPPQFYRHCEACGFDFRSGLEARPVPAAVHEPMNQRLLVVLLALGAATIGLFVYLSVVRS